MEKILVCCLLLLLPTIDGFVLRGKEDIILVPSVVFRDHSNALSTNWILYNQGWYYEEDPIQALLMEKSLEKILGKIFDLNRINLFTADGEEKKNLCINGLNRSMCTITDDDGRIKNTFQITNNELQQYIQPNNSANKILYQISVPNKNLQSTGEMYLCDDIGLTFLSDIDDTIKITGVTSTTDTLINTFSGDYKSVTGMADIYQYWQKKYNATFGYLTASPDQLYPFLREFLDRDQFPQGSFHMRHFTWLDKNFLEFFMSENYIKSKTNTIEMYLTQTLNRILILIGDIFQKDPEIYAGIYQKYSNRIGKIFIRKYQNDTSGQQRLEQVFKDIPKQKWTTFETGYDLPKDIF